MKITLRKQNYDSLMRVALCFAGIAINFLLSFITYKSGLVLFLDTTGTITVSVIGGIFQGIAVAIVTNVLSGIYNPFNIYFGFINAIVATYTVWFYKNKSFKRVRNIAEYILTIGTVSGFLSGMVQMVFLGGPQNQSIALLMEGVSFLPIAKPIAFLFFNIVVSILDKGLSLGLATLFMNCIPVDWKNRIKSSGWKQKPLSINDVKELNSISKGSKINLRQKIFIILLCCSLALVIIMSWIEVRMYFDIAKDEKTRSAKNAASFAAEMVDPGMISEYVKKGEAAPGYKETEEMLYKIRKNAIGVKYLCIVQAKKDGIYVACDLDVEGEPKYEPGMLFPYSEVYEKYLDKMLTGEEMEPVETASNYGWVLSVFVPIKDEMEICRGYACAGVSLGYMAEYIGEFLIRISLVMAGFFILILSLGLWSTGTGIVYPINSIGRSAENIIKAGDDQRKLDAAVRQMRSLDIHTGDEIEKLYNIICDMAANQAETIRSVKKFSEATLKMQSGLIITMADMVESRDSDTGAHILKTAEYARIIVDGLEKKGYYSEKINPRFKSDVVRSAPLHDIGKINISDRILNKPGKLTDEEYEIMKTHASKGRDIIEKAIDTVKGESYLKEARNMAAYHHERWDGKGYPEGLHGEVIPLSARIMAVADVFDALTSERVYKPPFPMEDALDIIRSGSGTQFDPKCVEVFMDAIPEVKTVLMKYNHQL